MGERPLMHYLGAARAANELERYDEADDLLNRAREREPDAQLLVGLTRAQLLINRGDYPQARNTLEELHGLQPQHRTVLRLMQQLYVTQHDWQALCVLLPELRKERVLKDSELRDLERRAWVASLQEAGERGLNEGETALQPLTQRWQNVPSALRADPAIVAGYAAQLLRLGAEEEAEEVLRHALKQGFDATLVQLYGQVRGRDPGKQLQAAEGWLKEHPNDPGLLLTPGAPVPDQQALGQGPGIPGGQPELPAQCRDLRRAGTPAGAARRGRAQQPVVPGGPGPARSAYSGLPVVVAGI